MGFNINEIKSNLTFGGARPTLFQVQFNNPGNSTGDLKVPFMVQAASIPPAVTGVIEVPYFGRRIKLAGDRIFPSWNVTVMNDEDFLIRNALEEWSNRINGLGTNVRTLTNYKSEATVTQFAKDGRRIRTYEFHGIFPTEISPIELDWAATDTNEIFTVNFEYDYWTVASGGLTGNAGGEG